MRVEVYRLQQRLMRNRRRIIRCRGEPARAIAQGGETVRHRRLQVKPRVRPAGGEQRLTSRSQKKARHAAEDMTAVGGKAD
jgi:hypothetical protein